MNPSELVKGCHSFLYDDGQEKVYCGGIDVFAHIPVYCKRCKARMEQALFMLNNYKWVIANHRIGNDIEILEKALNIIRDGTKADVNKKQPLRENSPSGRGVNPTINNQDVQHNVQENDESVQHNVHQGVKE